MKEKIIKIRKDVEVERMKEKIIKILNDMVRPGHCIDCEYYQEQECYDCNRDSAWQISDKKLNELADKILAMTKPQIEHHYKLIIQG